MARATPASLERIARLEARFESFMENQEARQAENSKLLKELQAAQAEVQESLAKYRGFWGAFLLIGSALATAVTLFGDLVRKKLGWE